MRNLNVEMSESHVAELVSEADSDSGGGVGHDQSNVDTESNTGTNQDQVLIGYQLFITRATKIGQCGTLMLLD